MPPRTVDGITIGDEVRIPDAPLNSPFNHPACRCFVTKIRSEADTDIIERISGRSERVVVSFTNIFTVQSQDNEDGLMVEDDFTRDQIEVELDNIPYLETDNPQATYNRNLAGGRKIF